jgi:hypothetical protein
VLHKYHACPGDTDNDLFFVLGRFAHSPEAEMVNPSRPGFAATSHRARSASHCAQRTCRSSATFLPTCRPNPAADSRLPAPPRLPKPNCMYCIDTNVGQASACGGLQPARAIARRQFGLAGSAKLGASPDLMLDAVEFRMSSSRILWSRGPIPACLHIRPSFRYSAIMPALNYTDR